MPSEPQTSVPTSTTAADAQPQLRRVLGLWDLVFYGIVLIQPVAAVGIFGIANQNSKGHVTTTILIAMVAMMFTAVSYGRMAAHYPVAGSAYTYVGRALNPHLGFIVGWAMFLDYLIIPVISIAYGAISLIQLFPETMKAWDSKILQTLHITTTLADHLQPTYIITVIVLTALVTFLNMRGIRWAARTNEILLAIMSIAIVIFLFDAIRYLTGHSGVQSLFSTLPLYNPKTFQLAPVWTATSIAALTYIGFDGITTLSEETKDPKKTVARATVLVCLLTGIICGAQVYLAQLVWPDYTTYSSADTAFFDVCGKVGGLFLNHIFAAIMVVASIGSALGGQLGAARVLYGMGRDNALPKKFFGRLDPKRNSPTFNIVLIGGLALTIAICLSYAEAVPILNFGAFLAFMGVNASVIRELVLRTPAGHRRNWVFDLILPFLGFAFCAVIWVYLPRQAMTYGGIWCALGIAYAAYKTRGFRQKPVMIDLSGA
ncbi:MAG: amino acid transporter [Verrucomicrobiales bacterium]|nr:amino acid transporter [Verrucomicrobiales bacterium]